MSDTTRLPDGGIHLNPRNDVLPAPAIVDAIFLDPTTKMLVRNAGTEAVPVWAGLGEATLPNIVLVDAVNGDDTLGGIGNGLPFKTMQAAINAIVVDNAIAPLGRKGYTLWPGPWQQFDEDLSVDVSNALHLVIAAQGGWMLGNFDQNNWRPAAGVGRDITFTGSAAAVGGIRPSFSCATVPGTEWNPTSNQSYSGARISGSFLSGNLAGNLEFSFEGEIFGEGNADAINFGTTIISAYLKETRLKKPLNSSQLNLFRAWNCRFEGLITCVSYSGIFNCELEGGMTAGGLGGVPPQGFFQCDLQGPYNCGGAGLLRLDSPSNFHFEASGATLAGGTTRTLLERASLVIADPGSGTAIPIISQGNCSLTIGAGAETNTLAIPGYVGQILTLSVAAAGGGTRTVTVAAAINKAGNTSIALTAAGDSISLIGMSVGGALRWRVLTNDGPVLA